MKRIMIMGCSGSGKSTLSNKMHQKLGIKEIPLDLYYLKPNWAETPKLEWEIIVKELSKQESWIMDGNYGGTMDIRIKRADTLIFLDYPTWLCLFRVIKRTIKHYNKVRPGMSNGCRERFSLSFLHYVFTFRMIRRKGILSKLKTLEKTKTIHILKNDKAIKAFLMSL